MTTEATSCIGTRNQPRPRALQTPARRDTTDVAYNIADLFEHVVDLMPDPLGVDRRRRPPDVRRARRASQPRRARVRRARRRTGDHIGIYAHNGPTWVEAMLGVLQDPRRPDQRQLPLRRGRAPVPPRQRRPGRRDPRPRLRRATRRRCRHDLPSCASRWPSATTRGRARRRARPTRLRRTIPRRPLHPLHRRHDRHAQGCGVAPRGRVHGPRPGHQLDHRRQGHPTPSSPRSGANTSRSVLLAVPSHARRRPVGSRSARCAQGNTVVLSPTLRWRSHLGRGRAHPAPTRSSSPATPWAAPSPRPSRPTPDDGTCHRCWPSALRCALLRRP